MLASATRRAGVADRCRSPTPRDDATAFLSPDDALDERRRVRRTSRRGPGRRRCRRSPRTRSTRRRSAPSRRRKRACGRCSSPATRWSSRWTPSWPARWPTAGVKVVRDAAPRHRHLQERSCVDWGELSTEQVPRTQPDAVVVFIGANEGFPMEGAGGREVECCGARLGGAVRQPRAPDGRHLPPGRERARVLDHAPDAARPRTAQEISRVVNAAVRVAAQPWARRCG